MEQNTVEYHSMISSHKREDHASHFSSAWLKESEQCPQKRLVSRRWMCSVVISVSFLQPCTKKYFLLQYVADWLPTCIVLDYQETVPPVLALVTDQAACSYLLTILSAILDTCNLLHDTFVKCDFKIIKIPPNQNIMGQNKYHWATDMEEIIFHFHSNLRKYCKQMSTTSVFIQILKLKRNKKSILLNIHSVVWEFFYKY